MYNGQFLKGLVHVVIFAVLVSASHVFHVFGLFVFGWICYQAFEAYHTAKARRDGEPLPDPLGLNDVGNWFGLNPRPPVWPQAGAGPGVGPTSTGQVPTEQTSAYRYSSQAPYQNPAQPGTAAPADWQTPYQGPYQGVTGVTGAGGPAGPGVGAIPPVPPVPPLHWRRREPIGAVILIALGILFLLDRIDFLSGRVFEFSWPLVLIGLGVWLIVRRVGDTRGGQK